MPEFKKGDIAQHRLLPGAKVIVFGIAPAPPYSYICRYIGIRGDLCQEHFAECELEAHDASAHPLSVMLSKMEERLKSLEMLTPEKDAGAAVGYADGSGMSDGPFPTMAEALVTFGYDGAAIFELLSDGTKEPRFTWRNGEWRPI